MSKTLELLGIFVLIAHESTPTLYLIDTSPFRCKPNYPVILRIVLEMHAGTLLLVSLPFAASLVPRETIYSVDRANEYIEANLHTVVDTYRYKYHAMAPIGWINDPNGFIYFGGEYHLFYQYNPYSALWDTMHWGHAKSSDLVTWERLPVALAPDQDYDQNGIFSGSAIEIDGRLYVMYTCVNGNSQLQCVAYSEDSLTFTKVPENPVIDTSQLPENAQPQDFRDPKVFKRGDLYYVVLASKTKDETGQILLYQSEDFINWSFKSVLLEGTREHGVMFECPDLFELDGKDVLIVSAIQMPKVGNHYENIDSVVEFVGTVDWDTGKFQVGIKFAYGFEISNLSFINNQPRHVYDKTSLSLS